MWKRKEIYTAVFLLLMAVKGYGDERDPVVSDVIVVTGQRESLQDTSVLVPDVEPVQQPDAAGLVARLPGAALLYNGSLSGQVQYRGLYGSRVAVAINGQTFHSGGPNLMDPPMHYAPVSLIERIEVSRGTSSVDSGPAIAGRVNAKFKEIPFNDGRDFGGQTDITMMARSVDDSYSLGGMTGAANDTFRFNLFGSKEAGDDIEFKDGHIPNSDHDRKVYGIMSGYRDDRQEVTLEVRKQETGPTGNAPFAMDIEYVNSDFSRLTHRIDLGGIQVDTMFGYTNIEHGMNNYDLRPAPIDPGRYRRTLTDARTRHGSVKVGWKDFEFGVDHEWADKSARITNPNNGNFYIESLPDIVMTRTGVYGQWQGGVGEWDAEIGVRVDRHEAEAGMTETGNAVPTGPRMLADAFDRSTREWDDDTLDAILRIWRESGAGVTWRGTLAHKSRAPGYVERFAWLPTPASGGLADGNTYVGDPTLEPEVATSAELGFDWYGERAFARPTIYYRHVDDFIQGVAFDATPGIVDSPVEMVSAMNGDTTPLRFANTRAAFYGMDVDFGLRLADRWRLDGVLTVVRGKRKDIDDELYRVTPDELLLGLVYEADSWRVTLESQFTAGQHRVSATNSEQPTSGYAIFRLYGDWQLNSRTNISFGLENIFDREYERHLAGYNRVSESDVPVGSRLPGPGRGLLVKFHYRIHGE